MIEALTIYAFDIWLNLCLIYAFICDPLVFCMRFFVFCVFFLNLNDIGQNKTKKTTAKSIFGLDSYIFAVLFGFFIVNFHNSSILNFI